MLPQEPGVPQEPGASEESRALRALQASRAQGVREDLQVLLHLNPAPPAQATLPLLTAAIRSASVVLALADRKSDTLLLRVNSEDHDQLLVLKAYDEIHLGQGENAGRAGREACALLRLAQAGVCVPGLVASGTHALLRHYVQGPTARDLHWDAALARQLAEWVFRCHEALAVEGIDAARACRAAETSRVAEATDAGQHTVHRAKHRAEHRAKQSGLGRSWLVGDMNLGNFVLDVGSGRLCGIDMGDTRIGDPLDDVGETCMRIVGRRPGFTADRWECAVAFASCYGSLVGSAEYVLSKVPERASASLRQMAVWRNDPFMSEVADAFPFLWGEALLSFRRAKQEELFDR